MADVRMLQVRQQSQISDYRARPSVATELLGAQIRFVTGKKWRHRIIEHGQGEPLYLIHGVGGFAESYARNILSLGEHFHVISVDARFHGFSSKGGFDPATSQEQMADGLIDLADALGHKRIHMEGESMGGGVAFELAMKYPDRAGRIILNTAWIARLRQKETGADDRASLDLKTLTRHALDQPGRETMRRRVEWLVRTPERMTDEMLDMRAKVWGVPEINQSMRAVHRIDSNFQRVFIWEESDARRIDHEILVLWTGHNPGEGPDFGRYLASLFENAAFYVIEDAAHWPQWEQPYEHDAVVVEFLKNGLENAK